MADPIAADMQHQQQQQQVTDPLNVPLLRTTNLDQIIDERSTSTGNPNVAALLSPEASNTTTITTTTTTNRTVNMDREDIETVKYLPIDLTSSLKQQESHHHHHSDDYNQDRGADDYNYDYDVSSTSCSSRRAGRRGNASSLILTKSYLSFDLYSTERKRNGHSLTSNCLLFRFVY